MRRPRWRRSALRQQPGLGLRTEGDRGLRPLRKRVDGKSVGVDGAEGARAGRGAGGRIPSGRGGAGNLQGVTLELGSEGGGRGEEESARKEVRSRRGDFVSHDREAHERTACVERDEEGRVAEPALTLETIVSLIVAMIFEGRDG